MSDIIIPDSSNIEEVVREERKLAASTNQIIKDFWKPNRKQERFLRIPFSIKEGFYGGGAGSGKSDVLLMYGIVHELYKNPKFKQVFMRRTHADLKKEIVQRSRELYRRFGASFNQSDMVWTFPRLDQYGSGAKNEGSMIFLGHCENEVDVHMYDSMEICLYSPDELTNCTEYIYLYITFERNRAPKDAGLPSITRGAGMPGGIGHTFVKKRFVDPNPAGNEILVGKGGNKRIYVHATLADNQDHIDPTYSQSLEGLNDAEKKAKKYGDWSAYLGQVFDEFRDKHYPDEPENALHVVTPFDIPYWWPKFVVGDWGYRAMTYIIFVAISPNKRAYVYREIYWTKTKIEEWAPILKAYIEADQPRVIKFCRSTSQDRGQENTVQQQIEDAIGRPIELSSNTAGSRVAGKLLLHEFLRWREKPVITQEMMPVYNEEKAMWILRNKGLLDYKLYLKLFDPPEPEVGLPKLQIFRCDQNDHVGHTNCCPLLIDSIKACSYDKPKNNKPAEDVAEFDGDDPYDTLRYAIDSAEQYFNESTEEMKRLQNEAAIMQKLHETQDFTAFYRNMRQIEADGRPMMIKSKYHRGKR